METELLYTLRSIKSKIYFILQLGYFKSKHLFFNLTYVKWKKIFNIFLKFISIMLTSQILDLLIKKLG
ncbi:DUF4158 domain-containing protein [Bacillus thuringiensis]|nr:DUF4158 domain-containing protein [Bacillus thuringiensis]